MIASQLNLSDAQKDQVKAIAQSHRDEWQSLADHVSTARQGLRVAITSGTFDEALVRDKSAALGQAEADVAVASARAFGEVFQILTQEQQAKLRSLQADGQRRRGQEGRQRGRAF
jgi:Spy/CpxP family protein refolding chaperone